MTIHLGVWDYVVCTVTILITAVIAGFRIYKDRVKNTKFEYFLSGHRSSGLFAIAMSSFATLVSGVGLIAIPAETYVAGISGVHFDLVLIAVSMLTAHIYLPVYYELNITSVMEYMEMRFNRILRIIAAVCYVLSTVMNNAIVLHVPALALSQVTGIGVWESMAPMAIMCILYTALGGFKTVVWTDVFQGLIMLATVLLILSKGLIDIGGFNILWERLSHGNRSTFAYFTPGPSVRYTIWANYFGNITVRLIMMTDQAMVQRQLASKTMKSAQISVYISCIGILTWTLLSGILGLIIYAKYFDCDPFLSGEITSRGQLAPYYVMGVLRNIPGLGGFYIGGIVAATLSTLSSSINSLSLIAIQDFVKPFYGSIPDETATKVSKVLAVVIGMTCLAFVLIFQNWSSALEALHAARGITGGPLLGLITLGMLIPFVSNMGAVIGSIFGLCLAVWIIVGATVSKYTQPYAPLEVYGCNETLGLNSTSSTPYLEQNAGVFPLYTMSFQLYTFVGFISTIVVGIIASLITGPQNPNDLPHGVIHNGVGKAFRKLPNWILVKIGYSVSRNEDNSPAGQEMKNISKAED